MNSDINDYIPSNPVVEPTWQRARDIVVKKLPIPSHLASLMRATWGNVTLDKELLSSIASTSLGAGLLYDAAGENVFGDGSQVVSAEDALEVLGPKLTATILAINFTCRTVLKFKPPAIWERLLRELMQDIEIGVKLGNRVPSIGVEGGVAIGFAKRAGLLFLLVNFPKVFRRWYLGQYEKGDAEEQISNFGCEHYQVSAFVMQQLGFGSEVALGTSLSMGAVSTDFLNLAESVDKWKAALAWLDALKHSRNYPADPGLRDYFPELKTAHGKKNTLLEVLYTEVAACRKEGAGWIWHLPKPSYEETAQYIANGGMEGVLREIWG